MLFKEVSVNEPLGDHVAEQGRAAALRGPWASPKQQQELEWYLRAGQGDARGPSLRSPDLCHPGGWPL